MIRMFKSLKKIMQKVFQGDRNSAETGRTPHAIWKIAGYMSSEEMDAHTVQIYWFNPDNFYMATKCKDQTWIVWENLGNDFCRNHIHFSNWREAVLFLYEESKKLGAIWGPESFGFRVGVNPFENEPDFSFYKEMVEEYYD
ncbi:hypothetical protein [Thermoactinomyces sp. DSM 45892]|uniref:hypothetical protein n=1 Tax=Thermoactinomyces sp. DSM 45892 TaxID=1882753 RepID=UPI0008992B1B|nr:hypothetical protein [Thermoactinomyces sp. DSM 45892]SDZ33875.1 hypothetical protein SAMN05444416_1233 [Thermoactinomyces sp. DSM 45892]